MNSLSLQQQEQKSSNNMATAIKAILTLKGKEEREFLRKAEDTERNFKGFQNQDEHSYCMMEQSWEVLIPMLLAIQLSLSAK